MTRASIILCILFLLLAFWQSGKAEAHPTTMQDVVDASRKYRVPLEMSLAIWGRECERQERCAQGKSGEWGPFQIMPVAAQYAECPKGWRHSRGNAFCAIKLLKMAWRHCKWRRMGAFSRYNRPIKKCRATRYARNVFHRMRIYQMYAEWNQRNWKSWKIIKEGDAG